MITHSVSLLLPPPLPQFRYSAAVAATANGGSFSPFHSLSLSSQSKTSFASSLQKDKGFDLFTVTASSCHEKNLAWGNAIELYRGYTLVILKLKVSNETMQFRFHDPSVLAKSINCRCGYNKNEIASSFGSDEDVSVSVQIPTQAQSLVEGSGAVLVSEYKPATDVDYLQLRTFKSLFYVRLEYYVVLGFPCSYIYSVCRKNHIFTSGASGTNASVIRGTLRAQNPELLTVILPQSLQKQSPESQELLSKVKNVIEKPQNDDLPLIEASRLCNMDIISQVQQVICFAFHDSRLLMETCQEAKNLRKIVTLFYLD
ncbi:PREDICTED: uncharacterized protein LOC105958802 [Erythranthe guttata]|uniref:uncharacterized protein LOC105958802 n=1 Tax=Erythranthe guttata TaxID=4155 RepID=UPI00064DCD6D|nr:PREDICTED: uncharacterized protein LOC105958802 [Erythranthe guttata]|eukprot:XP_012838258.1 PREDICTED: uncharacterized protein LOC105958802 [Erythranthe guttata]